MSFVICFVFLKQAYVQRFLTHYLTIIHEKQGQPMTNLERQGQIWLDIDRQGQTETERDRQGKTGPACLCLSLFVPALSLALTGIIGKEPLPCNNLIKFKVM